MIEADQPITIERYAFVPNSGGAGRYRGGLAIERHLRFRTDNATLQIRSDRRDHPPAERLSQGGSTVAYFEGTPIPTSVVLTTVLAFAAWRGRIGDALYWGVWHVGAWERHPLVLLFVASGTMMISKTLRIPKL